jgi:hypothetical protein
LRFSKWPTLGFVVFLMLAAFRSYHYPAYTSDGFVYMANAVAMRGVGIREIHDTVYREVRAGVPQPTLDHLLGNEPVETAQSRSFRERAVNPYHFAEFLPCFAVRPAFNELVYVLHYELGIGLLRAPIVISVASFLAMGWIVLMWISRYVAAPWAQILSLLLVLTPGIWDLARWPQPDALCCMISLLALYFLLEKKWITAGLAILLASVYVRTDNVLLVLAALAYLSILTHTVDKTKAAILAAVATGSVFLINHYAGDYGARMLYYRAFLGVPLAPGEMTAHFGFHDYLVALRAGVSAILHGDFIAFTLIGVVGLLRRPPLAVLALMIVALTYNAAHFLIYPLVEIRYFGLFYLAMGISLASTLTAPQPSMTYGLSNGADKRSGIQTAA